MNLDLITYYKERAGEYEKIYEKPERQQELQYLKSFLQDAFRDKSVLEIACGTGYWTQIISNTAKSIQASDINQAVIDIARSKDYKNSRVEFTIADFQQLQRDSAKECLFGGFIFSHIPRQEIIGFFDKIINLTLPGGKVILIDNNYSEGSSHPITDTDNEGNTYQTRKLQDGTAHKVLKNFPKEKDLRQHLEGRAIGLKFIDLRYYWVLEFTVPGA